MRLKRVGCLQFVENAICESDPVGYLRFAQDDVMANGTYCQANTATYVDSDRSVHQMNQLLTSAEGSGASRANSRFLHSAALRSE